MAPAYRKVMTSRLNQTALLSESITTGWNSSSRMYFDIAIINSLPILARAHNCIAAANSNNRIKASLSLLDQRACCFVQRKRERERERVEFIKKITRKCNFLE